MTDSHKSLTSATNTQDEEPAAVVSKSDVNTKIAESSQTTPPTTIIPVVVDTNTTPISVANSNLTPNKVKLNKEELKLSPIRKKSISSSSLLEDLSSITTQTDTTVLNGVLNNTTPTNNTTATNANTNGNTVTNEENKENDLVCNNAANPKLDTECSETTTTTTTATTPSVEEKCENGEEVVDAEKKGKNGHKRKSKVTAKQQIARFIAGWVTQKKSAGGQFNKKDVKNLAKISNTLIKSKGSLNDGDEENLPEGKEEQDEADENEDEDSEEIDDDEGNYNFIVSFTLPIF